MRQIYSYSQGNDRFEKEPAGVCQALSARWIVARAGWHTSGARGVWVDASWMGTKKDMATHVDRIYAATRAARAAPMTWSIVARSKSGAFGVAIASRFFAVGALCPHAHSGIGALAGIGGTEFGEAAINSGLINWATPALVLAA
jgi:hypothetical protein